MCHPPHPSQGDIITYLLFRKQDFQSSEAETNSDVAAMLLMKNLIKCNCCCKDTVFRTSALLIFTVNNWVLHNNPSVWEYCQMFLLPLSLFYFFFVWELKVSQVMTGLGSVKGKRQLCAFQLAKWFISLLPILGLSCIKPKTDWFSFTQKPVDDRQNAKKKSTVKCIYTSLRPTHSIPKPLQQCIPPRSKTYVER